MSVWTEIGDYIFGARGDVNDRNRPIQHRKKREEEEELESDKPMPVETPEGDKVSKLNLGSGIDVPFASLKRKGNDPIKLRKKKASYSA